MFQGIIEGVGEVRNVEGIGGGKEYTIFWGGGDMRGLGVGASIAVNGVCESMIWIEGEHFKVYASKETLSLTNLEDLNEGDGVNLEKPLRMEELMSGHLVQGHIDGYGWIEAKKKESLDHRIRIGCEDSLLKYIVKKGSIAVDGVSLTVNEVMGGGFEVLIIPITYERTVIKDYKLGSRINLEVDYLGKYVERLIGVYLN